MALNRSLTIAASLVALCVIADTGLPLLIHALLFSATITLGVYFGAPSAGQPDGRALVTMFLLCLVYDSYLWGRELWHSTFMQRLLADAVAFTGMWLVCRTFVRSRVPWYALPLCLLLCALGEWLRIPLIDAWTGLFDGRCYIQSYLFRFLAVGLFWSLAIWQRNGEHRPATMPHRNQ